MGFIAILFVMFSTLISKILPLVFAGQFVVGPVVPIPTELELCVHKAEICVLEALPVCGELPPVNVTQHCISDYEDCSYNLKYAHEPVCRMSYVWCKLELSNQSSPMMIAHCNAVYDTCPTL